MAGRHAHLRGLAIPIHETSWLDIKHVFLEEYKVLPACHPIPIESGHDRSSLRSAMVASCLLFFSCFLLSSAAINYALINRFLPSTIWPTVI